MDDCVFVVAGDPTLCGDEVLIVMVIWQDALAKKNLVGYRVSKNSIGKPWITAIRDGRWELK